MLSMRIAVVLGLSILCTSCASLESPSGCTGPGVEAGLEPALEKPYTEVITFVQANWPPELSNGGGGDDTERN